MSISVVICARNRESVIESCLKSVEENHPSEIIVVDGNSSDKTVEIAARYTDKIYQDEGKGLAYARQLGSEKAVEQYVAYVDTDVTLPAGTLETMLSELKAKDYAGIHAQILGANISSYWEWAQDQHYRLIFNQPGEREVIGTVVVLYQREILLKYKFDPLFSACEDSDLSYRLRKDGHKLGISSASIYHRHRAGLRSFAQQKYWYGIGAARFIWKHKSIKGLGGPSPVASYGLKIKPKLIPYRLLNRFFNGIGMAQEFLCLLIRGGLKGR